MSRRLWPFLLIVTCSCLFFGRFILSPGEMPFGQDTRDIGFTNKLFAVQTLETEKTFPLWTPLPHCGMPFFASLPMGLLYPPSLLYLFVPVPWGLSLLFVLHNILAGIGMYLLMGWKVKAPGTRVFSALLYAFSGDLITHIHAGHDGKIFVMTWAPWAFFFCLRALEGRRMFWPLLGGVIALCLMTPHVQLTYYLAMALGLCVTFHALVIHRSPRRLIVHGACLAGACLLAAAIALPQLIPSWQLSKLASRGTLSYQDATFFSMPPEELLDYLVPSFTGFGPLYWGHRFFKHYTHYLGVLPLILAILSLRRRDPWSLFWLLLFLFGLIMGLGGSTPVYRLVYACVPMIKKMRSPESILFLSSLSWSVLAGMGLEVLLKQDSQGLWRRLCLTVGVLALPGLILLAPGLNGALSLFLFHPGPPEEKVQLLAQNLPAAVSGARLFLLLLAVSCGLCALRLRRMLSTPVWTGVVIAFVLGDLWHLDSRFIFPVTPQALYPDDAILQRMKGVDEPFRAYQEDLSTFGSPYRFSHLATHGIETCKGYQNLSLRCVDELDALLSVDGTNVPALLDLMNVRFILSSIHRDAARLADAVKVEGNEGCSLYERPRVLPRYHFVSTVRWTTQEEEALELLKGRDFDPWTEAVVLSEQAETVPVTPGQILSLEKRSQSLRLIVQCPGDGFLVLGDAYYPSCRVTVDNHPTALYRTNHAFRGLQVPAGRHDILVTYSQAGILGLFSLSGLCLLGMAILTWRLRSKTSLRPQS